jgi:hypothetical protein
MDIDYNLVSGYTEDAPRFMNWLHASGNQPDDLSELESLIEVERELFLGEYADAADYAEETTTNSYSEELDDLPHWLINHIDWKAVWDRELRFDHTELQKSNGFTLIWASI